VASKKNPIEVVLMPLVVALVGIVGTHLITQQQERNALAKAAADRQVQLLEIFAAKVTSKDNAERVLALRLLRAVDGDLAAKLASAVAAGEPETSAVRRVAEEVADEALARARLLPRVYIHIRDRQDDKRAEQLSTALKKEGLVVPGVERVGTKAPKTTQLRYFRKAEEGEAQRILGILQSAGVAASLQYINGYEGSESIKPMHFEFWFGY
jgi:hypothetical protein